MKKVTFCLIIFLVFILCGLIKNSFIEAAVIDFEDFDLGGSMYLDVGSPLIFTNINGSGINVNIIEGADNRIYDLYQYGNNPLATGQALIDWNWPDGSNPPGTTILFSKPVLNFSLSAGDFGGDNDSPLMITVYDKFDNVIGTDSAIWNQHPPFATLSVDITGISKVIYNSGGTYANSTFIDDLTFTPIPLPSTLLLFLSGMLGMVGIKKKLG